MDLKVIIIESLCDGVFSSGHDLAEFHERIQSNTGVEDIIELSSETMMCIQKLDKVTIAEVNGLATAAGFQLAASCDLIVSTERSKFSIPGTKIGLYAATPGIALINNLPQKISFEAFITSKVYSAIEMYKHGLVNYLVQTDDKKIIRKKTLEVCSNILEQNDKGIFDNIIKCKLNLNKLI
jgi:enoyl-CoA hydratase/carnithine racemase